MCCQGNSKSEFRIAVRTRSRLSRTLVSGSPTTVKDGRPGETSTSTRTMRPSMPASAALSSVASTAGRECKAGSSGGTSRVLQGFPAAGAERDRSFCDAARRRAPQNSATPARPAARRYGRCGVDGEPVTRHQAVVLQLVPGSQAGHRRPEGPRDRRERVAALHAVGDPVEFARRFRRRRRRQRRLGRRGPRLRHDGFRAIGSGREQRRRRPRDHEALARLHAGLRAQVIRLRQVGAAHLQLVGHRLQRLAPAHGVPLERREVLGRNLGEALLDERPRAGRQRQLE